MAHSPDLQAQLIRHDPEAVPIIAITMAWWSLAGGRPIAGWLVLKTDPGIRCGDQPRSGSRAKGSQLWQLQIVAADFKTKRPV
jgi:hypothetical protein